MSTFLAARFRADIRETYGCAPEDCDMESLIDLALDMGILTEEEAVASPDLAAHRITQLIKE